MSNQTTIGELAINLKLKLEGIEKGIETAQKKLQEIEKQNEQVENSNKSLDASFLAMSATAVIALNKVIGVVKDCVNEYNEYTQAISSLSDVADYTGNNLNDMSRLMDKYSKYMTKGDLAATIKNFSLMNMTIEETDQMLQSLINSAIKNRNANYDVSTAVKVASDGYKQGLSTLSDSAGVTENLSVMLDNYAKSIGKTASQLTEEEKNQAYVNRTMEAAAPFAGAMAEYLDTLAGKQGQFNQVMRETQVAYAEALEPTLVSLIEKGTGVLSFINEIIEKNPELTAGTTAFIVTLTGATAAIIALTAAKKTYSIATGTATVSTKAFTAALLANPITWWIVGISAAIGVITTAVSTFNSLKDSFNELKDKLNETSEAQQRYNELVKGTLELTDENIEKIRKDKQVLEKQLELKKEQIKREEELQQKINTSSDLENKSAKVKQKLFLNNENINVSQKVTTKRLTEYNKALYNNMSNERTKLRSQLVDIAQTKADIRGKQELLNILKKGKSNTEEFTDAKKQLVKLYPELASVNENTIKSTQDTIDAENKLADTEWALTQTKIQNSIIELQTIATNKEKYTQLAQAMEKETWEVTAALEQQINTLSALAKLTPEDFKGSVTSSYTPKVSKSSGSKSNSNKKLDNYKKEIAHKKALDQLSINQEISMYEYALKKYAKTADERNEIREKIYELNKELANKEKEILEKQTEDYENYIQEQKNLRGSAYDVTQQTSDYNKIIQMHKSYLNQIMKDERLSLDERKEIYREELQIIRDYEQQKRDLRVEQIDNTVSQLTNAITKQLEEMQEKEKEMIDKNIEEIEKWKEARINAINEEYDARIEAINKELEALDKAEQEKTREEEDAEYERRKIRLEQLVEFEHDATTKANYQKELDKLIADYQKTLDKRALDDKKEELNKQKDLLQEEQDNKVQAIENEVEKQKEVYEKQLTDLEKYYNEQVEIAQDTAEKMLLNVEQNQNQIINLLKSYGNAYEITGQTLGEKLAQGINEGIANKIENIIARIQSSIDSGIENKIKEWTMGMYKYEAGANKPQTKTVNVTQNNYIEQNPELPSETYRKLKNVSESLAEEFAGM